MDLSFLNIFKDTYQNLINIFIIFFIGFCGWKTLSTLIKKKLESLESSKDEAQTQRINTLFRILKNFISTAILIADFNESSADLLASFRGKPIFEYALGVVLNVLVVI